MLQIGFNECKDEIEVFLYDYNYYVYIILIGFGKGENIEKLNNKR